MKLSRTIPCLGVLAALALGGAPARAADPTTADCLQASDASLKLGNEHKLRGERAQLLVCAAPSCPADIRKDCAARVDEVNAQLPTVAFTAKDAAGADLTAVRVTIDGEVVAEHLDGVAVPVDPGDHTVAFETPGQSPVTKKLLVVQGQKDRREAIVFGALPGVAPAATPSPTTSGAPQASSGGLGTQKALALVAGGVGVVGIGVGTAFGLVAMSKKDDAHSACPDANCPTPEGSAKWSDAGSAGTASTIGFVVGGVGLAAGAVLWLTAGGGTQGAHAQVGLGPGSLLVKGSW